MPKNFSGFLLGSCFVFLISYLTFLPSFNLALFGDDWLAFWRYLQHLGPASTEHWNHLTYFLTPYGPQDITMGLLYRIFGFQGSLYQMTSFTLRIIAAFSLYPIVFYFTKSKIATFFAVLFFAITATGIETTSWVFNMPSYVSIAFFNVFLFFYIKSHEAGKTRLLLPAAISFYLAYIWAPIRMTGVIPFIILVEIFWFLKDRTLKSAKKNTFSLLLILGVFLITIFTGQSSGNSNVWTDRFTGGISMGLNFLSTGRFDFIFYPIISFGGMFFPNFTLPFQRNIQSIDQLIFSIIAPASLIFLVLTQLIIHFIKNSRVILSFKSILLSVISWSLLVILIYSQNSSYFSDAANLFSLTFGGYILIFILFLLFKSFSQEKIAKGIFLALFWSFLSFFFAWWWAPDTIYQSYHRYLVVSAVGISMLLAIIISLGKTFKNQLYLAIVLSFFMIVQMLSTNYYLQLMENFHSQKITDKIWSHIPFIPDVGKKTLVFYFEGDNTNYVNVHNVITFGFPPHMQLLYNLTASDSAPVPMSKWDEVVSAVSDGQSFKPYGAPLEPIPLDQVYAFHLQGPDNLIDITNEARQKLSAPKK